MFIPTADVQMENGKIFSGEKISELAEFIINKFADEKLTRDEAVEVLVKTERMVGDYAIVQRI